MTASITMMDLQEYDFFQDYTPSHVAVAVAGQGPTMMDQFVKLKKKIIDTNSLIRVYKKCKSECEERDEKIMKMSSELAELSKERNALLLKIYDFEKHNQQLLDQNGDLTVQLQGLKSHNGQLQSLIAERKEELSKSKKDIDEYKALQHQHAKCESKLLQSRKLKKENTQFKKLIEFYGKKALNKQPLSKQQRQAFEKFLKTDRLSSDEMRKVEEDLLTLNEPLSCGTADTGIGSSICASDDEKFTGCEVYSERGLSPERAQFFDPLPVLGEAFPTDINIMPIASKNSKPKDISDEEIENILSTFKLPYPKLLSPLRLSPEICKRSSNIPITNNIAPLPSNIPITNNIAPLPDMSMFAELARKIFNEEFMKKSKDLELSSEAMMKNMEEKLTVLMSSCPKVDSLNKTDQQPGADYVCSEFNKSTNATGFQQFPDPTLSDISNSPNKETLIDSDYEPLPRKKSKPLPRIGKKSPPIRKAKNLMPTRKSSRISNKLNYKELLNSCDNLENEICEQSPPKTIKSPFKRIIRRKRNEKFLDPKYEEIMTSLFEDAPSEDQEDISKDAPNEHFKQSGSTESIADPLDEEDEDSSPISIKDVASNIMFSFDKDKRLKVYHRKVYGKPPTSTLNDVSLFKDNSYIVDQEKSSDHVMVLKRKKSNEAISPIKKPALDNDVLETNESTPLPNESTPLPNEEKYIKAKRVMEELRAKKTAEKTTYVRKTIIKRKRKENETTMDEEITPPVDHTLSESHTDANISTESTIEDEAFKDVQCFLKRVFLKYGCKFRFQPTTPTKLDQSIVDALEEHLVDTYSTDSLDTLYSILMCKNEMKVAAAMVDYLSKERIVDLGEVFLDNTPGMSGYHFRLLACLNRLYKSRPPSFTQDLYTLIMDGIQFKCFSLQKTKLPLRSHVSMAVFYTILCRITQQKEKLKLFCMDIIYFLGFTAGPMMLAIMRVWPQILPKSELPAAKDPIVIVIIHALLTKFPERPEYNISKLKGLLLHKYGFKTGEYNDDQIVNILTEKLLNLQPGAKTHCIESAFILMGKRLNVNMTYKKILLKKLLPIIHDKSTSIEARCSSLKLLGILSRTFPMTMSNQITEIINQIQFATDSSEQPAIQEAAIKSLTFFKHQYSSTVLRILKNWKPDFPVSKDTENYIIQFLGRKPATFWNNSLKLVS